MKFIWKKRMLNFSKGHDRNELIFGIHIYYDSTFHPMLEFSCTKFFWVILQIDRL